MTNLLGVLYRPGQIAQVLDRGFLGAPHAFAKEHGIRAGRNVVEASMHDGLRQNSGGGGAILRHGVGLGRRFLHDLDTQIEKDVVHPFNLIGDGNAVVGDLRRTQRARERHVSATRPERGPYGVGNDVDAGT